MWSVFVSVPYTFGNSSYSTVAGRVFCICQLDPVGWWYYSDHLYPHWISVHSFYQLFREDCWTIQL